MGTGIAIPDSAEIIYSEEFDIGGIFIGSTEPGPFKLQIDNLHLK